MISVLFGQFAILWGLFTLTSQTVIASAPPPAGSIVFQNMLSPTLGIIDQSLFTSKQLATYPEELQSAISNVLLTHPDWRRAKADLRRAISKLDLARSTQRFQINASADVSYRSDSAANAVDPLARENQRPGTVGAQIRARKLLSDFGSSESRVSGASFGVEEARKQQRQEQSALLSTILTGLLTRQRLLVLSLWHSAILDTRSELVTLATMRLSLGAGTIYELARTKTNYSDAKLQQQQLANDLKNIEEALGRIGVTPLNSLDLRVFLPVPELRIENLEARLITLPRIVQIDNKIRRLQDEVQAASRDSYPKIYLDAQTTARRYVDSSNEPLGLDYSVSINLEYALADGGLNRGTVSALLAELEEAHAERDLTRLTLGDELLAISNQIKTLQRSMPTMREAIEQAEISFEAAITRFASRRGGIEQIEQAEQELNSKVQRLIEGFFEQRQLIFEFHDKSDSLIQLVVPAALPFGL